MAKTIIEVTLHDGEPRNGRQHYEPGDELRGTVRVLPTGNLECRGLYVRLAWHTEGRGTPDRMQMSEQNLYQGRLSAGATTSYGFRFVLPTEPWSYAGQYVSIVWAIEVNIDVPFARNPKHAEPFILAPRRAAHAKPIAVPSP